MFILAYSIGDRKKSLYKLEYYEVFEKLVERVKWLLNNGKGENQLQIFPVEEKYDPYLKKRLGVHSAQDILEINNRKSPFNGA